MPRRCGLSCAVSLGGVRSPAGTGGGEAGGGANAGTGAAALGSVPAPRAALSPGAVGPRHQTTLLGGVLITGRI